MATVAADRHLLVGLIALQNGIINQGQLLAAFQAWTLDKAKSLADHLAARGDLEPPKTAPPSRRWPRSHLEDARRRCGEEPGRCPRTPLHPRSLAAWRTPTSRRRWPTWRKPRS